MRTLGMLILSGALSGLMAEGPMGGPCGDAPVSRKIVPDGEAGTPILVRGQVFRPDGMTPAAGVLIYAYQTGADGLYGPRGNREPRLRGWLKTDGEGRFRIETIRPGPYPNDRIAAHIHFQAWGPGTPVQYTEELLFDDDPLVLENVKQKSRALGRFAFVQPVNGGEVRINLRLKSAADRMEDNIRHGLRACGDRP